jgi:hypothetical protein
MSHDDEESQISFLQGLDVNYYLIVVFFAAALLGGIYALSAREDAIRKDAEHRAQIEIERKTKPPPILTLGQVGYPGGFRRQAAGCDHPQPAA